MSNESVSAQLIRAREVAAAIGVSERTVVRHIRSGVIRGGRIGRLYFVRREELDRLLDLSATA